MFRFNLFNNHLLSTQSPLSSLDPLSGNYFGTINNMELYPRRRHTEFYQEPQPLEDYQSRMPEHPQDKLKMSQSSRLSLADIPEEPSKRINPPSNSDTRMFRDSYFS